MHFVHKSQIIIIVDVVVVVVGGGGGSGGKLFLVPASAHNQCNKGICMYYLYVFRISSFII